MQQRAGARHLCRCLALPWEKGSMLPCLLVLHEHRCAVGQVPFDIPVTFTIVPHDPLTDPDGFLRYAMRMNGLSEAEFHTILTGVIHGQTRILAGATCMSCPCCIPCCVGVVASLHGGFVACLGCCLAVI